MTLRQWFKDVYHLPDQDLDEIDSITELTHLKPNITIIKRGQIATTVGFLLEGAIVNYFTDSFGEEKVVSFAFEGQSLVVFHSFFNQTPSAITSVTLEPCTIVWTDYKRYTEFVSKHNHYNELLVSELAKWMAAEKNRMEYLQQPTAKSKYEMMCKLEPKIIERVPLKHIASYLGITQETLSRIRRNK